MRWTIVVRLMKQYKSGRPSTWCSCMRQQMLYSTTPTHRHKVIVSESQDIYTNLALEEWIYETEDLTNQSILLMWRNRPAVVIGRHQNPWLECDVNEILRNSVDLARRKSGGGAVYHDLGNLNLSFLMKKDIYNRKKNLELVVEAITQQWSIDLGINHRDDILLEGLYKISGTASKLGRNKTYHHFTLLCNVNKDNITKYLDSPHATVGVQSRATQSLKANVKNLTDSAPEISYERLVEVIGQRFTTANNLMYVNPDDSNKYPDVQKFKHELKQSDWIYGKTPKFTLCRTFTTTGFKRSPVECAFTIQIDKGRINVVLIETSIDDLKTKEFVSYLVNGLCDKRFWNSDIKDFIDDATQQFVEDRGHVIQNEKFDWILRCLRQTLHIHYL